TERQAAERQGRSASEVADEIERSAKVGADMAAGFDDALWRGPAPPPVPGTLGEGVEAIWYDTYVHAQDIRVAVGMEPTRGPGLRAAVSHLRDLLTNEGWGPATLALDGLEEFAV